MPEWSTYTLSDFLMFAPRTYWQMVERYNRDFWPLQLPLLAGGLGMLWLTATRHVHAFRLAGLLLAAAWLWVGWAFLWQRYATINWAAAYVAAAFALQGLLMLTAGLVCGQATVPPGATARGFGWLLACAGLLYPLVGLALGRPLVQAEFLGMSPEPTALFTLGLLLLGGKPTSRAGRVLLFFIPLLCALLGAATGWTFRN